MAKILIVDSNPAEINEQARARSGMGTGEGYAAVLSALRDDLEIDIVAPYDGEALPDLDGYDGAVFTGSGVPWNVSDDRGAPIAAAMRAVFDQGIASFGSCNGMQLGAWVLGGTGGESPNGLEIGLARDIDLTEAGKAHPMLAGRSDGYAVPCIHGHEVFDLPEGAQLLASNAHSPVQAMAYEHDTVRFWGVQYHPEFTPDFVAGIMADRELGPPEAVPDLMQAEQDAEAAARLGTTPEAQRTEARTVELRNWLASL